ncbi:MULTISPECIES: hypothetical protein [Bacillus]|uniref:hypothetical protein n=1 Tax=Bacillus TaxID=1386 RepID=UPI0001A151E2|nr:hypothetical protein [Bacillus pseudomycoides]EEM18005.1 hypothetical protein bpmyx0001_10940 [Bacillus pseudomycoides DSM 12442]
MKSISKLLLKETGDTEWDDDIWDTFDSLLDEKGHDSSMPEIEFDWEEDDEEGLAKRFGENPLLY